MNLPNKITLFRVSLIPVFVTVYLNSDVPYHNVWAGAIFILAAVSDAVDGYLARKWELTTNFGKFMDPLADKLLVSAALICFVAKPEIPMPAWIVIVIISREFVISGYRLVAADKGIVISAGLWGKCKTVSQMVMSILLIFHFDAPFLLKLEKPMIYLSLVLTIVSLMDYVWKNKEVLRE